MAARGSALVRFTCERHLGEFEQPVPRLHDMAWCRLCEKHLVITQILGGAMCGKRTRWVVTTPENRAGGQAHIVEVVCTEPTGHDPDRHYDRTYNIFFPDKARKPLRKVLAFSPEALEAGSRSTGPDAVPRASPFGHRLQRITSRRQRE
jgi:hypothetical protein